MGTLKFRHTTKVPPAQTAGEITGILIGLGATDISTQVADGELSGMSFNVQIQEERLAYKLPIRWKPISQMMVNERIASRRREGPLEDDVVARIQEQAKRTAWRIVLEWLKVQMAFVETGARNAIEVFMADMIVEKSGGKTVGELMTEHGAKALLAAPAETKGKRR